jgi:hypothetical protein
MTSMCHQVWKITQKTKIEQVEKEEAEASGESTIGS